MLQVIDIHRVCRVIDVTTKESERWIKNTMQQKKKKIADCFIQIR